MGYIGWIQKITALYEKTPIDTKGALKQLFSYLKFFFYLQSHSEDLSLANCQLAVQGARVQN